MQACTPLLVVLALRFMSPICLSLALSVARARALPLSPCPCLSFSLSLSLRLSLLVLSLPLPLYPSPFLCLCLSHYALQEPLLPHLLYYTAPNPPRAVRNPCALQRRAPVSLPQPPSTRPLPVSLSAPITQNFPFPTYEATTGCEKPQKVPTRRQSAPPRKAPWSGRQPPLRPPNGSATLAHSRNSTATSAHENPRDLPLRPPCSPLLQACSGIQRFHYFPPFPPLGCR